LEEQTARDLTGFVKTYQRPVIVHTSFAHEPYESINILRKNGIPVFASSERTARCLGAMAKAGERMYNNSAYSEPREFPVKGEAVSPVPGNLKEQGVSALLETEAREVLQTAGISLPEAILAKNTGEAAKAALTLGLPVAMKIVSRKIVHKSDAGGVRINLASEEEVKTAFEEIIRNALKVAKKNEIEGVLISSMAKAGQECIVGMTRDHQFGPVIMFGLGGIFVEVLKDVSFRVAPLTRADAEEMVRQIKGFPLLEGIRGQAPKDVGAIVKILLGISNLSVRDDAIREIDLNPVIVHETGVSIVDARIIL
jgi:acetyltransferase